MKSKKSNKKLSSQLPSYKKPPVNEVICGMRYQTPANIWIPHIGILWSKFRQEYPNIQHANPIFSSPLEDLAILSGNQEQAVSCQIRLRQNGQQFFSYKTTMDY
ncbi:MAG: hypothetical protein WAW09_11105 [Smithella sp.]